MFPAVRQSLETLVRERQEQNRQRLATATSTPLDAFLTQGLMEAQSLLVMDLQRCTRCDACVRACADAHDGVTRLIREGQRFDKYLVATSCRHCRDPLCMVGCPVGSIRRRNSLEVIIENWCIGCGLCAKNCPYGNINMHPFTVMENDPMNAGRQMAVVKQKATSCDLCTDLAEPSCVYACPHDAAHRVEPNEFFRWVGTPLGTAIQENLTRGAMRIDRTHRPWVIATVALAIVSTAAYILYAVETPGGPRGGSALGLTFGIVGYAMMLYAGLLGARKQVPTWRLGRAQTWMRGHIWLGLLSLLLILFHGGFAFRGPLTLVHDDAVLHRDRQRHSGRRDPALHPELHDRARAAGNHLRRDPARARAAARGGRSAGHRDLRATGSSGAAAGGRDRRAGRRPCWSRSSTTIASDSAKFICTKSGRIWTIPETPGRRAGRSAAVRAKRLKRCAVCSAPPVHGVLDDLENICEEEQQLSRQIRIYRWLHGWLLVHVPLSIALLVLGAVHAVMASEILTEWPDEHAPPKKLAQRINLDYFKTLHGIPRWRRILSGVFVIVGLAWLGWHAVAGSPDAL